MGIKYTSFLSSFGNSKNQQAKPWNVTIWNTLGLEKFIKKQYC